MRVRISVSPARVTNGHGSRVRPLGSICWSCQPSDPRLNNVQRQLFSGLASLSVSKPLAKTSSPMEMVCGLDLELPADSLDRNRRLQDRLRGGPPSGE